MAVTFESISANEVESLRSIAGGRGHPSALQELFDSAKKTPGQWFVVYSSDKPKDPVQAFFARREFGRIRPDAVP